jgi:hypothetical protein
MVDRLILDKRGKTIGVVIFNLAPTNKFIVRVPDSRGCV